MNLSLADVGGAMLVVSQFTLLGDCRRGRRPDFTAAAPPELAERLYQVFIAAVAEQGVPVATGQFRQHMEVELVNDGPVTLMVKALRSPFETMLGAMPTLAVGMRSAEGRHNMPNKRGHGTRQLSFAVPLAVPDAIDQPRRGLLDRGANSRLTRRAVAARRE